MTGITITIGEQTRTFEIDAERQEVIDQVENALMCLLEEEGEEDNGIEDNYRYEKGPHFEGTRITVTVPAEFIEHSWSLGPVHQKVHDVEKAWTWVSEFVGGCILAHIQTPSN